MKRRLALTALLAALASCTAIHTPSPYLPDRSGIQPGESITVQGNENIYVIAHEHNVSMRELIALNELKPPFEVRPGQTLVLPAGGTSFAANSMPPPEPAPLLPVEKNPIAPIEPAGVSVEPLAPVASAPAAQLPANAAPQSLLIAPQAEPALNKPAPQQQATTTAAPAAATAATAETAINMVWPVQGPILSGFGSKGPGLNNDGINIGAPKGAPVVAAAPGTVVYAGDEMKGFGNLVLIRHQDDWVTAYAHLDRVLVKKDTVVGQGDEIGTVGKTGNVSSPQLHFETRKGGKPVDPSGIIKSSP